MNKKYAVGLMVGMVSMSFGILEVFAAGTASFKPPLAYDYNVNSPSIVELEVIETAGIIKSISAFWNSEGEVKAEVSANAGVAYTPIINGQLLTEGFMPGNQLRFRIKIGEGGFLSNFIFGYEDSSGVSRHFQNNDLLKFKYRKALKISGGNEELFNYPVKITVNSRLPVLGNVLGNVFLPSQHRESGGSQPDFKDIRFTAADGQTLLNYYLESKIVSPELALSAANVARNDNAAVIASPPSAGEAISAVFWIKIPQIPKEGVTIYMYYGNKDALDLSNPENVFLFYDDFNSDKINDKKWQAHPEFGKRLGINNGYLGLKNCSILSRGLKIRKGVLEFKAKSEPNAAIQAIAKGFVNKQLGVASEQMVYSSAYPGAEHTIAINDVAKLNIGKPIEPMKDYIYKVIVNNEGISFERSSQNYEKQAEIKFLDTYQVNEGYIGLKAGSSPLEGGSVYFDWVRVRPYTEVEPKVVEEK